MTIDESETSVDGRRLTIGDETVELPKPADDALVLDQVVVVLLRTGGRSPARDNVLAFDGDGRRVWTAEALTAPSDGNTYVSIREEDGELWAGDWKGFDHRLDRRTGERIETRFVK